jgi:hypothetical protein
MHAYTYQIALNPEITTINSLSGLTLPPVLFMQRASGPLAQLVEQLTFNQWVTGSNPVRLTTVFNDLAGIRRAFWFLSARHRARQKKAKLRYLT